MTLSAADLARAACRDSDPELFFPISDAGPALDQTARARTICARCPIQSACLEWALTEGIAFGIYGGLDEHERAALHRSQADARRIAAREARLVPAP